MLLCIDKDREFVEELYGCFIGFLFLLVYDNVVINWFKNINVEKGVERWWMF